MCDETSSRAADPDRIGRSSSGLTLGASLLIFFASSASSGFKRKERLLAPALALCDRTKVRGGTTSLVRTDRLGSSRLNIAQSLHFNLDRLASRVSVCATACPKRDACDRGMGTWARKRGNRFGGRALRSKPQRRGFQLLSRIRLAQAVAEKDEEGPPEDRHCDLTRILAITKRTLDRLLRTRLSEELQSGGYAIKRVLYFGTVRIAKRERGER